MAAKQSKSGPSSASATPAKGAAATARQAKIQAASSRQRSGASVIIVATVVVIVAIVAVVGGVIWTQRSTDTSGPSALPRGVTAPGAGFPAFTGVTPATGAPVLDLYEDFQCPACAVFEQRLGGTIRELAQQGKLKLNYHIKTFLDDNLGNDSSTRAGTAAFCAADAGKFQQFHDQVFPGQPATEGAGFTKAELRGFAERAGISGPALDTWQRCADARTYDSYLESVEKKSFEDKVTGTPTLRLNGKDVPLEQVQSPEQLMALVDGAGS
jgi:protein-disulfide isomerase